MEERRIFERFQVDLPVRFSFLDDTKEGTGKIVNISAGGGGMIVTDEKLIPTTKLEMRILMPDDREPLYTKGKVVWTMVSTPDVYKVGIKFDKVDLMGISRVLRNRKR